MATSIDERAARPDTPAAPPVSPPGRRPDLGEVLAPVRGRLLLAVGLQALGAVAAVVPFVAIVEVVRALLPLLSGGVADATAAWIAVSVAVAALAVRVTASWSAGMITHLADGDLANGLRLGILEHLGRLPLGWFDTTASGKVRKAAQDDVVALHHLVAHALLDATTAVVIPVVSIGYLFWVDWRMALICLIPLLLAVVLYAGAMRGAGGRYPEYERSLAELNAATVEFVAGIAVVKTFNQTGRAHARYRAAADSFGRFFGEWMRESTRLSSWMELVSSPAVVLAVITVPGALLVAGGVVAPVDLLPALLLGLGLTAPLLGLGYSFQSLREAYLAAGSMQELNALPEMPPPSHPQPPGDGGVEFVGVEFSYDRGTVGALGAVGAVGAVGQAGPVGPVDGTDGTVPTVTGIDLTLHPGTVTALVGPSGSGKSTLAKLVPRFYDVTAGEVRVGGADVRRIDPAQLYRRVGFVFQHPALLRLSLRENIRLGRPDATAEQVERAARAAQIHDRIMAEPAGYDTVLGEDVQFSGGEQQRVAIARALLADAPILVLDEATAYADPDSEAAIQDALSVLAGGRTVLVIAHRLHTITGVDQIVVLDRGRIVERGTHPELVAAGGRYAAMWASHQRAARVAVRGGPDTASAADARHDEETDR